jgi:hypothetical protein
MSPIDWGRTDKWSEASCQPYKNPAGFEKGNYYSYILMICPLLHVSTFCWIFGNLMFCHFHISATKLKHMMRDMVIFLKVNQLAIVLKVMLDMQLHGCWDYYCCTDASMIYSFRCFICYKLCPFCIDLCFFASYFGGWSGPQACHCEWCLASFRVRRFYSSCFFWCDTLTLERGCCWSVNFYLF